MNLLKNIIRKIVTFIKNHRIITGIILVVIGILIFVFRPKPQPPVATQTVTRSHFVQSISVSGTIQAKNFANLTFLIGGKLTYLGVKKGDYVKQYQTIATLDQRTTQKNLQNALIAYDKQRNTFDQTQQNANGELQHQQVPSTTDIKTDKTDAINGAVSRILQQNQDDLNTAVNSVELQALSQEQSVLSTPIAGIVTREDVTTTGVDITPSTTFSIVDPTSVVFDMDVDEADIGKINNDQKVNVTLDAFPDTTLHMTVASIDFVSHTTSTGGTAYTVEVKISENSNFQYKIGMNGNGEIITNEKDNVLSIPINAIADNNYVYVQTVPNIFEKRAVKLGLQNDTSAEVTSGLRVGEKIALDPTTAAKQTKK